MFTSYNLTDLNKTKLGFWNNICCWQLYINKHLSFKCQLSRCRLSFTQMSSTEWCQCSWEREISDTLIVFIQWWSFIYCKCVSDTTDISSRCVLYSLLLWNALAHRRRLRENASFVFNFMQGCCAVQSDSRRTPFKHAASQVFNDILCSLFILFGLSVSEIEFLSWHCIKAFVILLTRCSCSADDWLIHLFFYLLSFVFCNNILATW